jgi:hypothetical protein
MTILQPTPEWWRGRVTVLPTRRIYRPDRGGLRCRNCARANTHGFVCCLMAIEPKENPKCAVWDMLRLGPRARVRVRNEDA